MTDSMGMNRIATGGRYVERVVVGVFGNKQHGKDTVSLLIKEEMKRRRRATLQFALADPVKEVARHLLGMPPEVAWGTGVTTRDREHLRLEWQKYGRNGREWLQWVGTELGRDLIHADLWIDRAVDKVVGASQGEQVFVISDCRFHNERTKLRSKLEARFIKFHTVKVYRPDVPIDMSHPSEAEVASMPAAMFDDLIDNDSTLTALTEKVKLLCDTLEARLGVGVTE